MRWKMILGISLAVVVVLIVTAYLILASYDFNKFKPQITDLAKQYTGRELAIGGDIELEISLESTLVVSDVTFQNAPWAKDPQMAKIKRLEIQIAIMPLLRGNLDVSRAYIENPEILIEIDKSGKSNLEFEASQEPEEKAPKEKEDDSRHDFFKFKKMQIEGGSLIFKDHQRGLTETISIDILKFETDEFGAPADIDLNFSYNKTPFQITGHIGQLSGILDPEEQWPLNIAIAALGSTVSIQGHIVNIPGVITRPFKLGGTLAKPSLGLSPERSAKTVGQAIVGPGGIASLFLSHSSDKESPCAAALKIVGEGTPKTAEKPAKAGEQQKSGEKKKEGLGSKIKKLFDKPKE